MRAPKNNVICSDLAEAVKKIQHKMGPQPFAPYVETVKNSALSLRLKNFLLQCFIDSKVGNELDGSLLAANLLKLPVEDRPCVKTFLICLFFR